MAWHGDYSPTASSLQDPPLTAMLLKTALRPFPLSLDPQNECFFSMMPPPTSKSCEGPISVAAMPSKLAPCIIGIDVGGTNTDR